MAVAAGIAGMLAMCCWRVAAWLARAHAATQRLNPDYDAPVPARLSLRYAWNDWEESLARGLLRGIAAFFHVLLPDGAPRSRDAPVNLDAMVRPG
jgi:hypothetical protein